jgi:myo-inositol-1(or 4)-monophosphatase
MLKSIQSISTNRNNPYAHLIEPVSALVREGGQLILARDDRSLPSLQIEKKSDDNYVTEVDYAVQRLILDQLVQLTPDYAVIAEEAEARAFDSRRPTWILDPVDGTTNLMRDLRLSAVSLALHADGQMQLGMIYNPYANEFFLAVAGGGSSLNGRTIQVSDRTSLRDGLIGFGTTPYDRQDAHRTFVLLESVFQRVLEIRRTGSAAIDLAYVACSRLDGFFEMMLQPWDYAAGILLIREAGGTITNWRGENPCLSSGDSILASNGHLHEPLLDLIRDGDIDHRM